MNTLSITGSALRYEFLMQIRRRSIWLVLALVGALSYALWLAFQSGSDTTARDAVMYLAQFTAWFLPVGVGLVLADRLARDKKLRVDELLDTFPASPGARLLGKYTGSTLATLVPVAILYGAGTLYVLARYHDPQSLLLALEAFAAIPLPGILFAAGFSIALPAIIKVPLYQVLFIGYWFWANLTSPRFKLPTLTGTMLNATGPWAQEAFFHYQWVFLRLNPTIAQGLASIALLVGLGLAAVALAWLYQRWEHARR
jgi:ABC-type transport system involved in multi-copper enzyme maturation permease subunit